MLLQVFEWVFKMIQDEMMVNMQYMVQLSFFFLIMTIMQFLLMIKTYLLHIYEKQIFSCLSLHIMMFYHN